LTTVVILWESHPSKIKRLFPGAVQIVWLVWVLQCQVALFQSPIYHSDWNPIVNISLSKINISLL